MTKGTSIVFWNLRSIVNKLDNFKATIHNTHYKLFCITESWLKSNLDDTFLSVNNFGFYRHDRKILNKNGYVKRGGGITPPNIYMHRKCEVPGSKCGFTSRN